MGVPRSAPTRYRGAVTIGYRDCLHNASDAGDIDLPHAVDVEDAGLLGVDDESQVYNGLYISFANEVSQTAASRLFAEIHADEAFQFAGGRGAEVDADDAKSVEMG